MSESPRMNSATVLLEISPSSLKVVHGETGLEVPLERSSNGALTADARQRVTSALRALFRRSAWQPRLRAVCAIAANGVSVRRMLLPATAPEQFQSMLRLQIESEFPLSPDDLAWGWRGLGEHRAPGAPVRQEILLAAVKKEVVADYAALLNECGLDPVFTVAALVRAVLCPPPAGANALLEIGTTTSELLMFEHDAPSGVRVLPFGHATFTRASSSAMLESPAKSIGGIWNGKKLFLISTDGSQSLLAAQLSRYLVPGTVCEALAVESGPGRSAAIQGLKKIPGANGAEPLVLLESKSKPVAGKFSPVQPEVKKWGIRALALIILIALLPYAEAIFLKPHMTKTITRIKAEQGRLSVIDRELNFLQYLKQNQPPYLEVMYLFSKSAAPGFRIDGLNMNRRGEISLRASLGSADQVVEFRRKLIDSGFFSSVVVEEQAPAPNGQKVNVRLTLQWKPHEARASLNLGPSADEVQKALTNKPASGAGMPGGGMPGGLPPGLVLPPGVTLPPGMIPQ